MLCSLSPFNTQQVKGTPILYADMELPPLGHPITGACIYKVSFGKARSWNEEVTKEN